jgi:ribosomal protein L11 methyltransferase
VSKTCLGKSYPALDVQSASPDLALALIDDFGPTAVEERGDSLRIFFSTAAARDEALNVLAATAPATAIDVPDENWARRSQEGLRPVVVGRIAIVPDSDSVIPNPESVSTNPFTITIVPSMGFGTGHHATTRLCLAALQQIDLTNAFVLDVGTGSGVLAIAADRLGASRALGIDHDPDAIQSARENLGFNPDARHVDVEVADLTSRELPRADVVTANLTGALLVRSAATLIGAVRPGGTLILSGVLAHERDDVCRAFAPAAVIWEREEDGWVGLIFTRSAGL